MGNSEKIIEIKSDKWRRLVAQYFAQVWGNLLIYLLQTNPDSEEIKSYQNVLERITLEYKGSNEREFKTAIEVFEGNYTVFVEMFKFVATNFEQDFQDLRRHVFEEVFSKQMELSQEGYFFRDPDEVEVSPKVLVEGLYIFFHSQGVEFSLEEIQYRAKSRRDLIYSEEENLRLARVLVDYGLNNGYEGEVPWVALSGKLVAALDGQRSFDTIAVYIRKNRDLFAELVYAISSGQVQLPPALEYIDWSQHKEMFLENPFYTLDEYLEIFGLDFGDRIALDQFYRRMISAGEVEIGHVLDSRYYLQGRHMYFLKSMWNIKLQIGDTLTFEEAFAALEETFGEFDTQDPTYRFIYLGIEKAKELGILPIEFGFSSIQEYSLRELHEAARLRKEGKSWPKIAILLKQSGYTKAEPRHPSNLSKRVREWIENQEL